MKHSNPEASTLATKLSGYADTNTVMICVEAHLMRLAKEVADHLNLTLQFIPCRAIQDPADPTKTIGSVSLDDVDLGVLPHDLPQDYLSHQLALIRYSLAREVESFTEINEAKYLQDKNVIVFCDTILSPDSIMASIRSIKKRMPSGILVAARSINDHSSRMLSHVADDVVCLQNSGTDQTQANAYPLVFSI